MCKTVILSCHAREVTARLQVCKTVSTRDCLTKQFRSFVCFNNKDRRAEFHCLGFKPAKPQTITTLRNASIQFDPLKDRLSLHEMVVSGVVYLLLFFLLLLLFLRCEKFHRLQSQFSFLKHGKKKRARMHACTENIEWSSYFKNASRLTSCSVEVRIIDVY